MRSGLIVLSALLFVGNMSTARADGPTDTADEIHYSFGNTAGDVVFDWHGGDQTIYYGIDATYGQSVTASDPPYLPVDEPGPFREASLTGLQPGSIYHYKIGDGGPDHTFQTIPSGDFSWVDVGDTGSTLCTPWLAQTQSLIAAQNPAFVTHGGDISYANNCGTAAVHQYFVDQQAWSESAAFQPAWGNHEYGQPGTSEGMTSPPGTPRDSMLNYKGRVRLTNAQTVPVDKPSQVNNPGCGWETGSTTNTCIGDDWGWFRAGGVLFIGYPEKWVDARQAWEQQAAALMAQAQADPDVDFIVTYGHRPPYTSGTTDTDAKSVIDQLAHLYSPTATNPHGKYVLNVAHHIHNLEVFSPIDGLVNVVNGGGGVDQVAFGTPAANSVYRLNHPGILSTQYSASQHSLNIGLVCGPDYVPKPATTCPYGATLYSRQFVRAAPQPPAVTTALTAGASTATVGAQVTYTSSATDASFDSTVAGAAVSVTVPPTMSITSAPGAVIDGATATWPAVDLQPRASTPIYQLVATVTSANVGDTFTATATTTTSDSACLDPSSSCRASTTGSVVSPAKEWVLNPSVETSNSGWTGAYGGNANVTVSRTLAAAHTGTYSMQVTGLAKARNLSSGINDNPRWVLRTVAGQTYTQSLWVDPTFVGQKITLRLKEWKGSTLKSDKATTLTAQRTGWQLLQQRVPAVAANDQLSFAVYGVMSANQTFYADDFSLTTPN